MGGLLYFYMDELFKDKYQPGSSRLQGWDYSLSGTYFITICTKNREEFFGEVVDDEMILSKEGGIVEKYWKEITKHFANVRLDEFIVMPNHLHGIIVIENVETSIYGVSIRVHKRRDESASLQMILEAGFESSDY